MNELTVLQAVRLKGRVSPADLAATSNIGRAQLGETVERLTAAGLLLGDATLRISPSGRARLNALLAEERAGINAAALAVAYDDFRAVNADFKRLVTDWQLKNGRPNPHQDADYDGAVLARLDAVHQRVLPILATVAAQVPRLGAYSAKLCAAWDKVQAGEIGWLTRPLIDSYHTVWFELHEELIAAAGLTREAEAKAGEAQ